MISRRCVRCVSGRCRGIRSPAHRWEMSWARRTLEGMTDFIDPLEPGSFEHNGQRPEVDEDEQQDSFDKQVEEEFKTYIGEAQATDGPAPAG